MAYTQTVVIAQFSSLGLDLWFVGVLMSTVGAVGLGIAHWNKKPIKRSLIGWEFGVILIAVFHLTMVSFFAAVLVPMSVGMIIDERQRIPNWDRKKRLVTLGSALFMVALGVVSGLFMYRLARHNITLTSDSMIVDDLMGHHVIPRGNLEASYTARKGLRWSFWFIDSKMPDKWTTSDVETQSHSESTLSGAELYVDSHLHLLHADEVGNQIMGWAHTRPRIPGQRLSPTLRNYDVQPGR